MKLRTEYTTTNELLNQGESAIFHCEKFDVIANNLAVQKLSSLTFFSDTFAFKNADAVLEKILNREIKNRLVAIQYNVTGEQHIAGKVGMEDVIANRSIRIVSAGQPNAFFKSEVLEKLVKSGLIPTEVAEAFPN